MKKIFLVLLAAGAFITSCKKDENGKAGIFKGPETVLHDGKAWTSIQLDNNGNPQMAVISLDEAALNSLPIGNEDGHGEHDHENYLTLKFHPRAAGTIFDHVGLDWNPSGHEPEQIYDKPHFDFHFYMISEAEQMSIPDYTVDSSKFLIYPGAGYLPAFYVPTYGGVPQMGTHWVDITSPELDPVHPQPFTHTFIFGSYNGRVIFYEPMITLDFLKANNSFERAIPQPAKYQKPGFYPTRMRISKHDTVTDIILDGMIYRQAS